MRDCEKRGALKVKNIKTKGFTTNMFDGVPADQFHQFLAAASSRSSLPIPLSFSPVHHHQHLQHLQHQHHHGVSVSVPVPIQIPIPSSVSATPAQVVPPVITTAPTAGPTQGILGCFDLYPSHQLLEVVQQPQHLHHSGLHPGHLHHRQSPSPPADSCSYGIREERNMETMEGEEEDWRRSISVVTIPPPPPPPPAKVAADAADDDIPWSNDEVLTLLRIRSGMENWFPEFTWEHVSRKLEEQGYQRSADKCKEKFEEESRHFNTMSCNKNYRFFNDLDELYNDDDQDQSNHPDELYNDDDDQDQSNHPQPQFSKEKDQDLEREKDHHHQQNAEAEEDKMDHQSHQQAESKEKENAVTSSTDPSRQERNHAASSVKETTRSTGNKKRKRKYKFKMFKGFCETFVKRIVAQQENLHNKLIDDMLKRDEECIAREEAWKCQEMERLNKEIEMRAQEQVIVGDRQAKIIDLLKEFTTTSTEQDQNLMKKIEDFFKVRNYGSTSFTSVATSSSEILPHLHQNPTTNLLPRATSSIETTPSSQNPPATSLSSVLAITSESTNENALALVHRNKNFSSTTPSFARKPSQKSTKKGQKDTGKRWPRDEVQALINLKCSITNNNGTTDHDKEPKCPLWERISQGMLELGYRRSAKRCKEKWENINKYFRKTKGSNKKRSVESRTCPYFHQLSTLYSQQQQGTTPLPNDVVVPNSSDDHVLDKENCPNSPHKMIAN